MVRHGGWRAGRHGAGEVTESPTSFRQQKCRLSHWAWLEHIRDLKAHLYSDIFPQKDHTSSNKATPPNSATPFGAIFFQTATPYVLKSFWAVRFIWLVHLVSCRVCRVYGLFIWFHPSRAAVLDLRMTSLKLLALEHSVFSAIITLMK